MPGGNALYTVKEEVVDTALFVAEVSADSTKKNVKKATWKLADATGTADIMMNSADSVNELTGKALDKAESVKQTVGELFPFDDRPFFL